MPNRHTLPALLLLLLLTTFAPPPAAASDCTRILAGVMVGSALYLAPTSPTRADAITKLLAEQASDDADTIETVVDQLSDNGRPLSAWKKGLGPAGHCYVGGMAAGNIGSPQVRVFRFVNPRDARQVAAQRVWSEGLQEYTRTMGSFCGVMKPSELLVTPLQSSAPVIAHLKSARGKIQEAARAFAQPDATRANPLPALDLPETAGPIRDATATIRGLRLTYANVQGTQTLTVPTRAAVTFTLGRLATSILFLGIDYSEAFRTGTPELRLSGSNECNGSLSSAGDRLWQAVDALAGGPNGNLAKLPLDVISGGFMRLLDEAETHLQSARNSCRTPGTQTPLTKIADMLRGQADDVDFVLKKISVNGALRTNWETAYAPQEVCALLGDQFSYSSLDPLNRLKNPADPAQEAAYGRVYQEWLRYWTVGRSFCGVMPAGQAVVPTGRPSNELLTELTRIKTGLAESANVFLSPNRIVRATPAAAQPVDYADAAGRVESGLVKLIGEMTTPEPAKWPLATHLSVSFNLSVLQSAVGGLRSRGSPTSECVLAAQAARKSLGHVLLDSATGRPTADTVERLVKAKGQVIRLKTTCR